VELGLGVDQRLGLTTAQLRDLAAHATSLGYQSMWTNASPDYDPVVMCAAWHASSGLRTGISVVPIARNPAAVLALAARTAYQLTGGTFTLGVGAGSVTEKPIAAVRAYVRDIKKVAPDVPLLIGALGPQMLRLAGKEAEGAALNWCTPERVLRARAELTMGAEAAGRDPDDVTVAVYVRACMDADERSAVDTLRSAASEYASFPAYARQFGSLGLAAEAEAAAAAHAAGRPQDAPVALVRAVCLSGDVGAARLGLQAYREAGAHLPIVYPVATAADPVASVLATLRALAPG